MGITMHAEEGLFDGGPTRGLQNALRLFQSPAKRGVGQRVLAAVTFGWLPVLVLATTEFALGSTTARTFFSDVAVHVRFLVAAPLLILAEADAIPVFDRIARHFFTSGLITERDRPRYDKAIASTRRLLEAKSAELVAFLIVYAFVIVLMWGLRHEDTPPWYWDSRGLFLRLSLAGLWHGFVSLPLLLLLCVGWLWRLILWWRFLVLMAGLNLRLFASHPDQAGGLRFVGTSIRSYRLIAAAIASSVAATYMNFFLRREQLGIEINKVIVGVVVLVLVLAIGPLVMFLERLRETRSRGIFRYGDLARDVGIEFEREWLDQPETYNASTLETSHFSAMTDLNQVVGNVYNVKDVPFSWRDVSYLVVAAVVPFVPVAMMAEPLGDFVQLLKQLIL